MSYSYSTERPKLFTEEGQVMFLKIRDNADRLIDLAGAATFDKITARAYGDSWTMLACLDRLVELGELVEVPNPVSGWAQHRLFTRPLQ